MSYYLAEYKLEQAIAALIKTAVSSLGIEVLTGVDEQAIDYGCVLVNATEAEPVEIGVTRGNFNVNVSVKVFTNCTDRNEDLDTHMARINAVRGVLMNTVFETNIDTAAGETITFGNAMLRNRTKTVGNGCWIHETNIVVPCIDGA